MTQQDLTNLNKLAQQQKSQRAFQNKKKLKQTHDKKLAESLAPLTKKLEGVNQSTEPFGYVIKESNSNNETPQLPLQKNQVLNHNVTH